MAYKHRRSIRCSVAVASLLTAILTPALSTALDGSAPEPYRIRWKPTVGKVRTVENVEPTDPRLHAVNEVWTWATWVAQSQIQGDRADPRKGIYEHELRFGYTDPEDDSINRWCDPDNNVDTEWGEQPDQNLGTEGQADVIHADLGADGWYDNFHDEGDYTWVQAAWDISEDHPYQVKFRCRADPPPTRNDYMLVAQAGHCHSPCTNALVFQDETARLLPKQVTSAPDRQEWFGSFPQTVPSFETGLGAWTSPNGTRQRQCSTAAWHGECFAVLTTNQPGVRPRLEYEYRPTPSSLASSSVYSEFVVQCPASLNLNPCPVRTGVTGYRADGTKTDEYRSFHSTSFGTGSEWKSVKRSDQKWYVTPLLQTPRFDDDTTRYTFWLEAGAGVNLLRIDYHQQSWHLLGD